MSKVITINAVDVSSIVKINNTKDVLTREVNTCSFVVKDLTNTHKPLPGQEIIITEGATTIFAGIIQSAPQRQFPGNTDKFVYDCEAVDYTNMLDHKLVIEEYSNQTLAYIINDIITKYAYVGYFTQVGVAGSSPTVDYIQFNYMQISECFQKLAEHTGWDWYIDYNKDLHFFPYNTNSAPYSLTDTPTFYWRDLLIEPDITQVKNKIYVKGGDYLSDYVYFNIVADGEQSAFNLPYKAHDLEMRIGGADWAGGTPATVGIDNIDDPASYEYMHNFQEKTVKCGTASVPAASTVIRFKYKYDIPVFTLVEDTASQAALKAIEGGDGIRECLIEDSTINTLQAAEDRAQSELDSYADTIIKGSFITNQIGFRSGQLLTINITNRGVNDSYLIQSVRAIPVGSEDWEYEVVFATVLFGLTDFLRKLWQRGKKVTLSENDILMSIVPLTEASSIAEAAPTVTEFNPPFKWSSTDPTKAGKWGFAQWK